MFFRDIQNRWCLWGELSEVLETKHSVLLWFCSWYKDGEQILTSIPGYIVMKNRDLRIVANEFNEGVYTCRVHRSGDIVSANSWAIRLKPESPSNS